jgi:Transcriptional regulators
MKAPFQLLRAARVALDVTHVDLVREAGISKRTLSRLETPLSVSEESAARVQAALEARGVVFLEATGDGGPGFRVPPEAMEPPPARRRGPDGRELPRRRPRKTSA